MITTGQQSCCHLNTWHSDSSIMKFKPDHSYRLVIGIEACHDQLVSNGQYTVEQSELKLDLMTEKDAAGSATYKATHKGK